MIIRPFVDEDGPALVELILALNHYEQALEPDRSTTREDAQAYLDRLRSRVAKEDGAFLVAELDGMTIGYLVFVVAEQDLYVVEAFRRHGYIAELFVAESARRSGVGRALMRQAERLTRERGLSRLAVGVLARNALARSVYDREGFRHYTLELLKTLD